MVSPYMALAETGEGYVVQLSSDPSSSCLLINRSGHCSLVDREKANIRSSFSTIAGIIGIVHLHTNYYLITATGASEVGQIYAGKKVYKLTSHAIIPLTTTKYAIDEDEVKYLDLLKTHLTEATLYFSYDYDLTSRSNSQASPLSFASIDTEFMWNYYASQELFTLAEKNPAAGAFILPFIYGYAKFVRTKINMKPLTFGLVTRRSNHRAGTRYFRRGIDKDGYVANFNETEQFLIVHTDNNKDEIFSYTQTRGSVPVFWAEMNNLKYKPDLLMGPGDYVATRKHFNRTISKYGTHYLVNLVNQKGYEKPVKLAYENAVTALADDSIKYTYFDFHHECRKMRWDRVKLLLQHLSELGLSNTDYACSIATTNEKSSTSLETLKNQGHTVRTNCMDCLDRTNVVQSTLAHWVLQDQLEEAGIIPKGGRDWKETDPAFNFIFQNAWADNADAVSNSYSGTGALKTDYTRTGQRTRKGAWNDFVNSITRYIKNNYKDGSRQDGYDLFLGNVLPFEMATSPFQDLRPSATQSVPYFLLASLTVFTTAIIYPKGSLYEKSNIALLGICFAIFSFSLRYMISKGPQFVNWPKLSALDFLTKRELSTDGNFSGLLFEKSPSYNKFVEDNKKE